MYSFHTFFMFCPKRIQPAFRTLHLSLHVPSAGYQWQWQCLMNSVPPYLLGCLTCREHLFADFAITSLVLTLIFGLIISVLSGHSQFFVHEIHEGL